MTATPNCIRITPEVGGFVPCSSTDWPGRLVAVVFLQGCPWRCGYCHNPELQATRRPAVSTAPRWDEILAWLPRRQGLLDGVVFSGGEPSLDPALPAALAAVRELGFATGLHSAGLEPQRLARLLPLLDWLGLDLKAGWADYAGLTGVPASAAKVRQSLAHVQAVVQAPSSALQVELRTTWHPALVPWAGLHDLADELAAGVLATSTMASADSADAAPVGDAPVGSARPAPAAPGWDWVIQRWRPLPMDGRPGLTPQRLALEERLRASWREPAPGQVEALARPPALRVSWRG